MILGLFKLKGSATKAQIFPIYKKEGFSPRAIENVFKSDLIDLGEVVEVEGGIDNLQNDSVIYLTEDPNFMRFLKKHIKPVVRTLKMRKPQ